jgi:DNA polymerase-3 subunit gamma/tau
MTYQVLARKWRPRDFGAVVGQEHVVKALRNALDDGRLHHAYLFSGTRGVGKTTLARIVAKCLNCESGVSAQPCGQCSACREIDEGRFVDLLEVDAASRTKVEDTRDLLENVPYAPARGRYKVYLIDEVHMLSTHSFNALLKTLEEPPPHVKFLLATTDPQRLPMTVLSRCLQFNLKCLTPERIAGQLRHILTEEGVEFEPGGLRELARAAEGSMRDALSLLDQAIAHGAGTVREADVRAMLGTLDRGEALRLIEALAAVDAPAVLAWVAAVSEQGSDYGEVLAAVLGLLQRLALAQWVPAALDEEDREPLTALAAKLSPEEIQLFYQIALVGYRDMGLSPYPRGTLEMTLLRMLAFRPVAAEVQAVPDRAVPAPAEERERSRHTASPRKEIRESDRSRRPSPPEARKASTPVAGSLAPGALPDLTSDPSPQSWSGERSLPSPLGGEGSGKGPGDGDLAAPSGHFHAEAEDWDALVGTLRLGGLVRELATHSVLKERAGDTFRLVVDPSHAHLLSKNLESRLRDALAEHLGTPVKVTVEEGSPHEQTPAQRANRDRAERRQAAVEAIESDPNVQSLRETFNADLRFDSVRPADEESSP